MVTIPTRMYSIGVFIALAFFPSAAFSGVIMGIRVLKTPEMLETLTPLGEEGERNKHHDGNDDDQYIKHDSSSL